MVDRIAFSLSFVTFQLKVRVDLINERDGCELYQCLSVCKGKIRENREAIQLVLVDEIDVIIVIEGDSWSDIGEDSWEKLVGGHILNDRNVLRSILEHVEGECDEFMVRREDNIVEVHATCFHLISDMLNTCVHFNVRF